MAFVRARARAAVCRAAAARRARRRYRSGTYPALLYKKGERREKGEARKPGSQRLILIGVDDIEINELIETIGAMVLRGIGLGVNHLMIGVQTADGPSRGVGGVGFVAVVGLRAGWSSTVVLRGDHARRARPRRAFPQATTLSIRAAST